MPVESFGTLVGDDTSVAMCGAENSAANSVMRGGRARAVPEGRLFASGELAQAPPYRLNQRGPSASHELTQTPPHHLNLCVHLPLPERHYAIQKYECRPKR